MLRLRTDDQLVALFRMGYDEAFQAIFDRYRQRLFAYTRQMLAGSPTDAEDALQDVFLRAYSALRTDDRPVTLRAWLYRVAHNRCIDQLRRPAPAPADLLAAGRTPLQDPMAECERREDLRRLVADVQRLPEQQRSALLLRELDGLSYQELGDVLDVSLPAVKSLLVRARMGLVEAGEARDTACTDIRRDLLGAHDRGVRCDGRARRHLRDCGGCRDYHAALRATRRGFGAFTPGAGPLATLAKLLGIGGAGSAAGASAGAGGAATGTVIAGGVATGTATKVAAVICCAAVVGAGSAEVQHKIGPVSRHHAEQAPAAARPAAAVGPHRRPDRRGRPGPARRDEGAGRGPCPLPRPLGRRRRRATRRARAARPSPAPPRRPTRPADLPLTGGTAAPAEESLPGDGTTPATSPADPTATSDTPVGTGDGTATASTTGTSAPGSGAADEGTATASDPAPAAPATTASTADAGTRPGDGD